MFGRKKPAANLTSGNDFILDFDEDVPVRASVPVDDPNAWRADAPATNEMWDDCIRRTCYIFGVRSEKDVPSHLRDEFDETAERLYERERNLTTLEVDVAAEEHYRQLVADLDAETRHNQTMTALNNIQRSIDSGNIAAKTMNFVQRHPILAGFLGMSVYHKIRDR